MLKFGFVLDGFVGFSPLFFAFTAGLGDEFAVDEDVLD
jgi:hypothetical protein